MNYKKRVFYYFFIVLQYLFLRIIYSIVYTIFTISGYEIIKASILSLVIYNL